MGRGTIKLFGGALAYFWAELELEPQPYRGWGYIGAGWIRRTSAVSKLRSVRNGLIQPGTPSVP